MAHPIRIKTSEGWQDIAQGPQGAQGPTGPPGGGGLAGAPIPWITDTIPVGYREFDGSAIVQATHPQLYALFGATMPDLRGKFLLGANPTYPARSVGGAAAVALATAELPAHAHGVNAEAPGTGWASADHTHNYWQPSGYTTGIYTDQYGPSSALQTVIYGGTSGRVGDHYHVVNSHSHGGATGNAGSGTAHNNLPPYYAVRWITYAA